MKQLLLFAGTYLFGISLDLIWLRLIANQIYVDGIGHLLRKQGSEIASNVPSALMVYAILSFGIIYFALPKAGTSFTGAMIAGACFGIVTYGIYDFTNYALLADWPFKFSLIDLSWGIFLSISTTCFAYFLNKIIA